VADNWQKICEHLKGTVRQLVVKTSKVELLRNMVPPARLERPTPGLGMRTRVKMQVVDMQVIAETAVRYRARALSNQFPSV
jgi:hypothetical protein